MAVRERLGGVNRYGSNCVDLLVLQTSASDQTVLTFRLLWRLRLNLWSSEQPLALWTFVNKSAHPDFG